MLLQDIALAFLGLAGCANAIALPNPNLNSQVGEKRDAIAIPATNHIKRQDADAAYGLYDPSADDAKQEHNKRQDADAAYGLYDPSADQEDSAGKVRGKRQDADAAYGLYDPSSDKDEA